MLSAPPINHRATLLIVDDDPMVGHWVEGIVDGRRYRVVTAATAAAARQRLNEFIPSVVFIDEILPDRSGLELLRDFRRHHAALPVIVLAATRDAQVAIEAMKSGAVDCVRKPLEIAAVRAAIAAAESDRTLAVEPQQAVRGRSTAIVGESPRMQRVFKSIGQAACTSQPTLIIGASGTGKETIARALHDATAAHGPLTFYYCPAQPHDEDLRQAWQRLPSPADSATLVLQEIGELSLVAQTRLLQFLTHPPAQHEQTTRGGQLRVVATSSYDLAEKVDAGEFRADLYYALSVNRIVLPSLCERWQDLELLIQRFASQSLLPNEVGDWSRLTPAVLQLLQQYSWPGNLDELSAFVRSCRGPQGPLQWIVPRLNELQQRRVELILNDDENANSVDPTGGSIGNAIGLSSLSGVGVDTTTDWQQFVTHQLSLGTEDLYAAAIAEAEAKFLQLVLDHTAGNQAQAARILGITRASLRKRIRSLGLAVG
ncbi:MAG: sigma-54-dependent Fis family transcriptional regulator [Planctomycetales bacterium]|nr:sigma-54-dependent Fis family transcriptional regulator [Planctomycetales bacterium]